MKRWTVATEPHSFVPNAQHQALAALTSTGDAAIGHAEARCLEWLPVQVLGAESSTAQPAGTASASAAALEMEEDRGAGVGGGQGSEKKQKKRKKKGGVVPMET